MRYDQQSVPNTKHFLFGGFNTAIDRMGEGQYEGEHLGGAETLGGDLWG